jgi:polyphosphate kinase
MARHRPQSPPEFRCVLRDREQLDALVREPLPAGLRESAVATEAHRDIYFDTADALLRSRGATYRLRYRADGRAALSFDPGAVNGSGPARRVTAELAGGDVSTVLSLESEPARRVRAFTDPALLLPQVELEVSRTRREGRAGFLRRVRAEFLYDDITIRHGAVARAFQELKVRATGSAAPLLAGILRELQDRHALRASQSTKLDRAESLRARLADEAITLQLGPGRSIALVVVNGAEIAVMGHGEEMRLPSGAGAGEEACRHALHTLFRSRVGELHRVGSFSTESGRREVEVWLVRRVRGSAGEAAPREVAWRPLAELAAAAASNTLRDPVARAALRLLEGSGLLNDAGARRAAAHRPSPEGDRGSAPKGEAGDFLDPRRSELAFIERVLGLAEDVRVPLLERIRYLGIVSANLDEVYMGAAGALRTSSHPERQQEALELGSEVNALVERQARVLRDVLGLLAREGVALADWDSLGDAARSELRAYFRNEIFPQLTPRAITVSPGHPFPQIPALSLAFAVVLDGDRQPQHYAYLRIPDDLPRFLPIPGSRNLLPIEQLVRAELASIYPDRHVAGGWLFRITRTSELEVDEQQSGNLLQAMEEDVGRRKSNPVVRVEVEAGIPADVLDILVRELRLAGSPDAAGGIGPEIRKVGGLLALSDLRELAETPLPGHSFPPFVPGPPFRAGEPLWDTIRERNVLVHHPYDDFAASVVRLLEDAAADPDVVAIRMTLYRAGDRSPLVEALQLAARRGKDVSVFVELKARFDEARNTLWVRRLEAAGAHVVYGLVGLKNHAKVAMVVRREGDGIRRYSHIATGNYNVGTARVYTDLGMFTADPVIGGELNDLFNQLTGASGPPAGPFDRLLVAPLHLLPQMIARIDREAAHAREGRRAGIRIKCNGIADAEVVRALYRASQAGVDIDLSVRGICTVRPGVPNLSERIRVRSILGRFLEHARIYNFENGGAPEYFIGSADLRPRNLRERVEVLVPVDDEAGRQRLDRLLDLERNDPTAWRLEPDGRYARPSAPVGHPASAQQALIDGTIV